MRRATARWVERSNIIKLQFPRFLYQTLCVFSLIKDIKHIERDFHYVALEGAGGLKLDLSEHGHVAYKIEEDDE